MATNGPVSIQGCAVRLTRLNADGSCSTSSTGMIQDDLSLVKLEMKPNMEAGVEITPKSACGVPVISYKDCDRYKRWDVSLTLGDFDPEMLELVGQGAVITGTGTAGRTFADGVCTEGSNIVTSAADASFVPTDIGRTLTGVGLPTSPDAFVIEVVSATEVRISAPALTTEAAESMTLGAQAVSTIGYAYPHLLLRNCPFGISIEVWSKLIVRGTGYQGATPYPSSGTPEVPGSGYMRAGVFRAFLWHDALSFEDKEQSPMFTGWAIENPNFGTGPADDWRETATPATGIPVDTSVPMAFLCDFQLPTPLQPGYQMPPA